MSRWNDRSPQVENEVEKAASQFDAAKIVEYLRRFARGYDSRVKLHWIALIVFGLDDLKHGSADEVALRSVLKDIVTLTGEPIGSKGGSSGGFWFMLTEQDREEALAPLRSLEASVTRRRQAVETVKLTPTVEVANG